MRPSGSMMRFMGRRESDSSPPIRVPKRCAARMPESMRMVEPEFPASRSAAGCRKPSNPRPWIDDFGPVLFNRNAQRPHGIQRGMTVGARGIVPYPAVAFGDGGDHGIAVGDRFIARQT